jgi:hypothetical protein
VDDVQANVDGDLSVPSNQDDRIFKVDMCSQFGLLPKWSELQREATFRIPIVIRISHQKTFDAMHAFGFRTSGSAQPAINVCCS